MQFFVITPHRVDPTFSKKQEIIERVAFRHHMTATYAPSIPDSEDFDTELTFKLIQQADFFIADLSYERPSCYYEVGFAQGLGKKVYLIATVGTPIHQVKNDKALKFYQVNLVNYQPLIEGIFQQELKSASPRFAEIAR